jgi:hypothetical protein
MSSRGRGGAPPNAASSRIPAAHRKMQEAQFFFSRLGRKPPVDTLFTAGQVHRFHLSAFLSTAKSVFSVATVELQDGTPLKTWRDTLSAEDQDFLLAVLGQRDLETHGRGIRVEEQEYQFEPVTKTGWLAELVPERFFVIGERRYGAYFVASRILGLLAGFLGYVEASKAPSNARRANPSGG